MKQQRIIISNDIHAALGQALSACEHDKTFVLTDDTTLRLCLPFIKECPALVGSRIITIPSSDSNKSLESLASVWRQLGEQGATRHSCLINLGGGMVTDLGGFAASTFKRGINFINIPTTLLAMVDASVGGKTGINFNGLKNEIGVFNDSDFVILDTNFLHTLDAENICSGYAEMLKHALIHHESMWAQHVSFNLNDAVSHQPEAIRTLRQMVADSVSVKEHIVLEDPHEKGLRKALNLGHTFGHAFESWTLRRKPVLHGYAVAWGLIPELYLSVVKCGFPANRMRQTVQFIREHYGHLLIGCDDYAELIELMHHDKKNRGDEINVTLLKDIGELRINQALSEAEIKDAFDFFRET